MGRAERGVAGERELLSAREDPDPVVGAGILGGQEEGGFREVGPVGELLHGGRLQPLAIKNDGQRIATIGLAGEHIHLVEGAA